MLTKREREVLGFIARGYRDREISAALVVEPGTVKNHIHNILRKLGVTTRQGAVKAYQMTEQMSPLQELACELAAIHLLDKVLSYDERNRAIIKAVFLALLAGLPAGFRLDPEEPDWPVAFIELPNGQVSWHLPAHVKPWDGHTVDEKYARVLEFCKQH